jgi:hypothetical protein
MHKELLRYGIYYTELLEQYPEQETLIKGILLPIDIDMAVKSDQGTILTYNKDLVKVNEAGLIEEVEIYVYEYLSKWYNSKYTVTDEYYLSNTLANLYSGITLKILNIRLDNVFTDKVHPFHMDKFFESHRRLNKDIQYLDDKTRLWLYKNVRYLEANIGLNTSLDLLIQNVFEVLGVGVGELTVNKVIPHIDLSNRDINKPIYGSKETIIKTKALNNSYKHRLNTNISLRDVIKKSLSKDITDAKDVEDFTNYYTKEVSKSLLTSETKTKILELDIINNIELNPYDEANLVIDTWFYTAKKDIYTTVTEVIDPNNNIIYNITPKQGMFLFLTLLGRLNKIDNLRIGTYKYTSVFKDKHDLITDGLISKEHIDVFKPTLNSLYPARPTIINDSKDFSTYIQSDVINNIYMKDYSGDNHNLYFSTKLCDGTETSGNLVYNDEYGFVID